MSTQPKWRASAVLLAMSGIVIATLGVYFIAFRPPLLPEDIRFMTMSDAEVANFLPRLAPWLTQVFRVLGGYALATGLLAATLAVTSFRSRSPTALVGAALAGASSIGLMTAVNFTLNSDFKWLLAGIALLWALALVCYAIESRTGPQPLLRTVDKGKAL